MKIYEWFAGLWVDATSFATESGLWIAFALGCILLTLGAAEVLLSWHRDEVAYQMRVDDEDEKG